MVVGHVAPEAYAGGLIALVEEGDTFEVSIEGLGGMPGAFGRLRLTRSNPAIMAPRREPDENGTMPPLRH